MAIASENEHRLSGLTWLSVVLVVIGALNWALVGLFDFNLVAAIFGDQSIISRIIYAVVGLAGIYIAVDAATRLNEPVHRRTTSAGVAT